MKERFSAFISYSHSDERVARWLHRAIEGYRFPNAIVGQQSEFGPITKKLPPVFRDRDELAASGDLGAELLQALASSRYQIVICSPRSANSHWVNEEIITFKRQHGENRTLALIAAGEPHAGGADECFPEALRFRLRSDGMLSDQPAEPIAADIRPGKDGKKLAYLKLLAGVSGVRLDALVRRDAARRQRQMAVTTAVASAVATITLGLAVYAENQRRIAVSERDLAESSLKFLIGTFEIANPATENPRTITALTILDRASERAAAEFSQKPQVAAMLLRATGDIYYNLGLQNESERNLLNALRLEPVGGEGRPTTLLKLASLAKSRGDVVALERLLKEALAAHDEVGAGSGEIEAMATEQRGHVAYLKADYALASKHFASAASRYAELQGDYRAEIGDNLMNQAYSLVQAEDYTHADKLYLQARQAFIAKFGVRDVRTARAYHNQAFASLAARRPDAAVNEMARALSIYERVLDPRHPHIAAAHLLMGRIFSAQGEYSKASTSFNRSRRIFFDLYGADNPAVGDVDFYAAETEALAGKTTVALGLANNVQRIYDLNYGEDDPDQVELMLLLSRINHSAGKFSVAKEHCRSALLLQRKLVNEKNNWRKMTERCRI